MGGEDGTSFAREQHNTAQLCYWHPSSQRSAHHLFSVTAALHWRVSGTAVAASRVHSAATAVISRAAATRSRSPHLTSCAPRRLHCAALRCAVLPQAVMRMLLADYIKLVNVSSEDVLYDEKDLAACIEKIELIDYHQVRRCRRGLRCRRCCCCCCHLRRRRRRSRHPPLSAAATAAAAALSAAAAARRRCCRCRRSCSVSCRRRPPTLLPPLPPPQPPPLLLPPAAAAATAAAAAACTACARRRRARSALRVLLRTQPRILGFVSR
jgi:hypothetical protein